MSCNAPADAGIKRSDLDPRTCGVYSRLETDAEFRTRFSAPSYYTGGAIDDYVWSIYKKQRRIVEVVP